MLFPNYHLEIEGKINSEVANMKNITKEKRRDLKKRKTSMFDEGRADIAQQNFLPTGSAELNPE